MSDRPASRTAVLVCQARAAAHGTVAPERFRDATARSMLREAERVAVDRVRAGGPPPRPWGERVEFEMVRAGADVIVPRTVRIDEAVQSRRTPQLVILGAGLDGRAWRMPELADVDVFEVDHPASQDDKRDRVANLSPVSRTLRFVPVDFATDRLAIALEDAGHDAAAPTGWIWEGVVPYLTRPRVEATMAVIDERSAPGSSLIVNYQSPALSATAGRLVARAMMAAVRRRSPWRAEPWRSLWTPVAMRALLTRHGFAVADDDDLLTLVGQLGTPVRRRRSLRSGRVAIAIR